MLRKAFLGATLCMLAAAAGCTLNAKGRKPPAETPAVPVSQPVQREITEHMDYIGRTEAVLSVDVRARVTGHLTHRYFTDGAFVKKGQRLFEIDPRPYQAQLDQAISQVKLNEASLNLTRKTYERNKASPGAVSHQQLDEDFAAVKQAVERVNDAKARVVTCRLNLEFTEIHAPIDGQISRSYLTEGNLIDQQTLLTTIVSVDPMHVYFDMDQPTRSLIIARINNKVLKPLSVSPLEVRIGVQGEEGYPHKGYIDFFNNQLTATTGSITVRGVFANPKPWEYGERVLEPGMFVRVRLPIGKPKLAKLVIDRAIGSDQGQKYVFVVDADNKVQYRPIETGPLQPDGLRVIKEGLKADDWVVVGGLPQIRAHMAVRTDRTVMPTVLSGQSARDTLRRDPEPKKQGQTGKSS